MGIGYFEHLGSVSGNESLAVQFTGDQPDDLLKSLTAVDLGNGRVVGISYDSPTPAERRLQALRMPLSEKATTLQVLDALRGSRVEVRTGAGTVVSGRVLHVERRTRAAGERTEERDELTVITDGGEIATVEIGGATRVRMADADLRQDVGRYLDIAAPTGIGARGAWCCRRWELARGRSWSATWARPRCGRRHIASSSRLPPTASRRCRAGRSWTT